MPISRVCLTVTLGPKTSFWGFGGRGVAENGRNQVFLKDSENSINFRNFEVWTKFVAPAAREISWLDNIALALEFPTSRVSQNP